MRIFVAGFAVAGLVAIAGCETPNGSTASKSAEKALGDPAGMLRLADASRQGGDFPAAIRMYRMAIAQGGDGFDVHLGLATALSGNADYDQAKVEFDKAAAIAPTRPESALGLGRMELARHRPTEALSAFQSALLLAPDSSAAWNGKGVALDQLEHHKEAQQAYLTGLEKSPNDRVLKNNYGLSLALSGDHAGAVKILTALVQESGATSRNRQNLALALGLEGDNADAKIIGRTDLDEAAVENNLRFYQVAREAPTPNDPLPVSVQSAFAAPPAASAGPPTPLQPNAVTSEALTPAPTSAAPQPAAAQDATVKPAVDSAAPQAVAQPVADSATPAPPAVTDSAKPSSSP